MFPQESLWLQALEQKKRIESSRVLNWINRRIRIPLSVSAARDRFFLRHIPRGKPTQQILDVGCGSGRSYLPELGVATGIDLSPSLLDQAKKLYARVVLHDILEMSTVLNQEFDVVVSSDVIGHIPFGEKTRLYDQLKQVTKIGGVSIHFIECEHDTFWTNMTRRNWPELFEKYFIQRVGHIGMEGVDQIRNQFETRGFRILEIEKVPGFFQEIGILSSEFNHDDFLRVIPGWMKMLVKFDALLARNIWVREFCNIALRPVTWIESKVTSIKKTTAVMLAAKREE